MCFVLFCFPSQEASLYQKKDIGSEKLCFKLILYHSSMDLKVVGDSCH